MKQLRQFSNLLIALSITTVAFSQTEPNVAKTKSRLSIEIDPLTFILKGYSLHLRFNPNGSEHLWIGAGTYALNFPTTLVNLNKNNKNLGWKTRLSSGNSLFGEYHFAKINQGAFLGTQLGIQTFKISNTNFEGDSQFTNGLAMLYLGYTIQPFKNDFYFKPWAGIGYTGKISGKNQIATNLYHIAPITSFLTLHMGYTF